MKLLSVILPLLSCHLALAQFVKGDRFIAGGYSVYVQNSSQENDEDDKNRSFQVYPEVGFFLNDKYAVGAGLNFSSSTYKYSFGQSPYQEQKNRGFGVYLFAKKYVPIADKFFFSLDGSIGYDRGRTTRDTGTSETTRKSYSIGLNVTPSLIFFPTPSWGIEGSIGGLGLTHSRGLSDEFKSTSFGLNYGNISLGFAYFFRAPAE